MHSCEDRMSAIKLYVRCDRGGADVIREFGYVPFDVDGARLLCQVKSECYERRSVIFTANVKFSRWDTFFVDDKLAAAIVDCVVHHGSSWSSTTPAPGSRKA